MDENYANIATYKQNPFAAIVMAIILPIFFYFFLIVFLKNNVLSITIALALGIIVVLIIIFNYKSIYVSDSDITIKSLFGIKKILWSDIISMATVVYNRTISYQMKTKNQTITIPQMTNYTDFENKVVSLAHLQVAESSPLNTFNLGLTPNLRRWTKAEAQYTPASTTDSLNDMFYVSFWKKHVGLAIFVVVAMVIFFIVFIYSLSIK